ncbi:hypothetical protein [Blastomonas sp. CACIA14H2]|uniref:hypothetical protein n=1 Tax=Blastomonas sp. CACIA14H2 TaxID=1419876 RepID=UPI004058B93F
MVARAMFFGRILVIGSLFLLPACSKGNYECFRDDDRSGKNGVAFISWTQEGSNFNYVGTPIRDDVQKLEECRFGFRVNGVSRNANKINNKDFNEGTFHSNYSGSAILIFNLESAVIDINSYSDSLDNDFEKNTVNVRSAKVFCLPSSLNFIEGYKIVRSRKDFIVNNGIEFVDLKLQSR